MPLTYQSPWMPQEAGNSLGELLARVPQVRAQQAMMQQQLMLEQLKAQNEQQYQSGMLGYHSQALGLQKQQMEQNQPEIDARTQYLLGQTGVEGAKQKELEKVMSLADMFGKAYRKSAGYPNVNDYQGGPTMQNQTALNNGDLAQSEATLEAMRPHDNLIGSMLRLQAQQQQGQLNNDQLNAILTGGHIVPHSTPMIHGKPGDVVLNPTTGETTKLPGQPYEPESPLERWAGTKATSFYKAAEQLPPFITQSGTTNRIPNPEWSALVGSGDKLTNYFRGAPSSMPSGPSQNKAITATNPKTGQRVQSFDGGKTWQPISQ